MTDGFQSFPSLLIKKSVSDGEHSVNFNSEQGHKNTLCSVQQKWPWSKRVTVSHWPAPDHSCSIETALCNMKRKIWQRNPWTVGCFLFLFYFVEIKHEDLSSFVNFETGDLQSGNLGKKKCPFLKKNGHWTKIKRFMSTMERMNTNGLEKSWFNVSLQWEINMSWYHFIASLVSSHQSFTKNWRSLKWNISQTIMRFKVHML